jgi:LAO/AO transport system kinase
MKEKKSALHISEGTENPGTFDPKLLQKFRRKKHSVKEYVEGIMSGNRILLSQAITLVESSKEEHQAAAEQIVAACLEQPHNSIRIGITGSPGVGKSTFIESFGKLLIEKGLKVAVLAIDPSSQLTHGSILGDKTRMQDLSVHPSAFVRPSPAGDSLGGVARKTRETIFLCEAAGFEVIIIETVGVGQSETAVHSMVDFFLLLLLPNAGDELQGIKRGVVEMADLIAVNKSDGAAMNQAKLAKAQYQNALHLFPPKAGGWIATAELCSGLSAMGIDLIWDKIVEFKNSMQANGHWQQHRAEQSKYWMHESIMQHLKDLFYHHPAVLDKMQAIEQAVEEGKISSFKAAKILLDTFLNYEL